MARFLLSPSDTAAVAGSVQIRNRRACFLTRLQHFDYYLSIASIKRQQALLQGTLVAQGAFSVYRADAVRAVGGWQDMLGEDIVLTWAMLRGRHRTVFEPTAVAYTDAPTGLRAYFRQRQRWSRGMIEGLRLHGSRLVAQRRMVSHSIVNNYLMPYLDAAYTVVVPVGIVLALRGEFLIIGPLTLAVMPVNLTVIAFMRRGQRRAYDRAQLPHPHRDIWGFVSFLFAYHLITAPAACSGYLAEAARVRKRWWRARRRPRGTAQARPRSAPRRAPRGSRRLQPPRQAGAPTAGPARCARRGSPSRPCASVGRTVVRDDPSCK